MAFYEMLPGTGMPSGLQAGMDSVLNKKFGTSTTYPAASWPDDVNLLGLLEEKTASGAIVTFSDGADTVPLKKCEITLPASLDGYSSVDVKHSGANLLDFTVRDHFGITCEKTADGGAKMSGTATNTSYPVNWIPITLPAGTYHVYISAVGTGMTIAYSKNGGYGGNLYAGDNVITLNAETEIGGYIRVSNGTVISDPETVYMQLSVAQADFEPYTAPTTHTATLGRTIYGGTADVVAGSGESKNGLVTDFSTLRANGTSTSGAYRYIMDVSGMGDYNVGACISNLLNYRVSWNADVGEFYNTANVLVIFLSQDNETDAINYLSSNSCKVAYPLATPETFTFDPVPIDSKLGNNTIWSEQGSAEVTYRSQGTVYQYPNAEEASF